MIFPRLLEYDRRILIFFPPSIFAAREITVVSRCALNHLDVNETR